MAAGDRDPKRTNRREVLESRKSLRSAASAVIAAGSLPSSGSVRRAAIASRTVSGVSAGVTAQSGSDSRNPASRSTS